MKIVHKKYMCNIWLALKYFFEETGGACTPTTLLLKVKGTDYKKQAYEKEKE